MRLLLTLLICLPLISSEKINLSIEPLQPITKNKSLNTKKILLGKKLFFDKRFSKDNSISCASCHIIKKAGVDNLKNSTGVEGKKALMNTPTVLNSSSNFVQFWDGRAKSLEDQIDGPIHNTVEMNTNWIDIIKKLKKDIFYRKVFKEIYHEELNKPNIKNAIVEYEKSLITPSRFDRYLLGDNTAISQKEKKGYALFKSYGCTSCHQGKNIGGNIYQKLGVFKQYFQKENTQNLGRYNILKTENSKHVFKVPSLRNIALTYPYLHDGSIKTLEAVIQLMATYQLGREIPKEDILKIEAFLNSLTWEKLEKSSNEN